MTKRWVQCCIVNNNVTLPALLTLVVNHDASAHPISFRNKLCEKVTKNCLVAISLDALTLEEVVNEVNFCSKLPEQNTACFDAKRALVSGDRAFARKFFREGIKKELACQANSFVSADGGTRTHDPLLRRQVLYPLSYVSIMLF